MAYYESWNNRRNAWVESQLGPAPAAPLYGSGEYSGDLYSEGEPGWDTYQRRANELSQGPGFLQYAAQTWGPEAAQQAADAFQSHSSKIARTNKIGKIAALGTIGGIAGAGALTSAGLLGGASSVAAPTLGTTYGGSGSLLGGGLGGTGSGLGVAGVTTPSALTGTGAGLAASGTSGWLPSLGAGAAGLSGLSGGSGGDGLISSLSQTGLGALKSGAGSSNPIMDFFQGLSGSGGNKGGFNVPNTIAGLFDAYSAYRQGKEQGNLADSLMGLFKPGGDYSEELRRQLERRDAQAGRRSQYGPREVELQAKLAGLAANTAKDVSGIYSKQGGFLDRTLSSGLDTLNSSGAMAGLSRLFAPPAAAGG